MYIDDRRVLILSFVVSIILHATLVAILYFLNFKLPEPEKEKIITVSLDMPPLEDKPKVSPFKEEIESKEEKPTVEKPTPAQPIQRPITLPEQKQQALEKPPEKPDQPPEESKAENSQTSLPTPQAQPQLSPQPTQPQKIDLSQGRPEQFKTPPKKDEDIDGYLKDLIRHLNQQARERDLYPPIAKRLKIEGEVIVRLTINEDGTIEENSIMIVEGSGYNVLDRGAIEILKKLQPLKKPPKRITVEIPIIFQIIYM